MSKNNKIEWSKIDGALPRAKRLHLEKDEVDSLYHCPIQLYEHEGFQSQRGCRKHVNNKHSWFFHFDEKPVDFQQVTSSSDVPENISLATLEDDAPRATLKQGARSIPSFSVSSQFGDAFTRWLTGSGGGYKKDRPAQQIVSRCFKFLKFCCEEEEELNFEVLDFSLCSSSLLFKFVDFLQDECKLGYGRRLGYIDAISELIDVLQKGQWCIRCRS